jgi:hypothetical protein
VILAVHIPAGALLGQQSGSMATAFGWGVLSHAAIDLVPHHDPFGEITEICMTAGMLSLVAALTGMEPRAVTGSIGGALPDLEHLFPWVRRRGRGLFPTHSGQLHHSFPDRFKVGTAGQLSLAAALTALLALRR